MDEILETLEHQSDLIRWESKDGMTKDQKELINLAQMAVDEAVSYLYDYKDES